jgi:hypothetical protein
MGPTNSIIVSQLTVPQTAIQITIHKNRYSNRQSHGPPFNTIHKIAISDRQSYGLLFHTIHKIAISIDSPTDCYLTRSTRSLFQSTVLRTAIHHSLKLLFQTFAIYSVTFLQILIFTEEILNTSRTRKGKICLVTFKFKFIKQSGCVINHFLRKFQAPFTYYELFLIHYPLKAGLPIRMDAEAGRPCS